MTPRHHASDETLLDYAAGKLSPGAALVVAAHLEVCDRCSGEVRFLEAVGAALMTSAEPEPLSADAVGRVLDRAVADPPAHRQAASASWPKVLVGYRIGRWRWAGRGLSIAQVHHAGVPPERVYLLRAGAGVAIPAHTHNGVERVVVLEGAFVDGARFDAGDLCESSGAHAAHSPVSTAEGICLCLVATDGRLGLTGGARLAQGFLGI